LAEKNNGECILAEKSGAATPDHWQKNKGGCVLATKNKGGCVVEKKA
jgi:hypothetical protein